MLRHAKDGVIRRLEHCFGAGSHTVRRALLPEACASLAPIAQSSFLSSLRLAALA